MHEFRFSISPSEERCGGLPPKKRRFSPSGVLQGKFFHRIWLSLPEFTRVYLSLVELVGGGKKVTNCGWRGVSCGSLRLTADSCGFSIFDLERP